MASAQVRTYRTSTTRISKQVRQVRTAGVKIPVGIHPGAVAGTPTMETIAFSARPLMTSGEGSTPIGVALNQVTGVGILTSSAWRWTWPALIRMTRRPCRFDLRDLLFQVSRRSRMSLRVDRRDQGLWFWFREVSRADPLVL